MSNIINVTQWSSIFDYTDFNMSPKLIGQKTDEEAQYKQQIDHLANSIIMSDYNPHIETYTATFRFNSPFIFPKDCIISGSYVMDLIVKKISNNYYIPYDDIDIYFKSLADAKDFVLKNDLYMYGFGWDFKSDICSYGSVSKLKLNLIYGIPYEDMANLISRYDIRACSVGIDPNKKIIMAVKGAVDDSLLKRIVFNPVPRGVSVRRFTKYIQKGFTADRYQNLFFAELLRSDLYSKELELNTKDY